MAKRKGDPLAKKADETLDLGSWFILRMSSKETLSVAKGLAKAGFDVWTPIERRKGKMPRTRTAYDKEFALMPSYVFVNIHHLAEIQHLSMLPPRNIPQFTLFQYQGGVPLIADHQLDALRAEESRLQAIYERQCRKGKKGPRFNPGTLVRIDDGGFAGMEGVVEDQQGQFTLVSFAGFHAPIKVASVLLEHEKSESETKAA